MRINSVQMLVFFKIVLWLAALAPLANLGWGLFQDLGANPVETMLRTTGDWVIRLLLISLVITPLRWIFRSSAPIKFRRMLGMFSFFYAILHLSIWLVLENSLDPGLVWADILKRPFVTAGMTAFLLLLPLAVTSTRGWIKRLGKKWTLLHKLVYPASVAGIIHFIWIQKADLTEPLIYAAILTVLLGSRMIRLAYQRVRNADSLKVSSSKAGSAA